MLDVHVLQRALVGPPSPSIPMWHAWRACAANAPRFQPFGKLGEMLLLAFLTQLLRNQAPLCQPEMDFTMDIPNRHGC